MSYKLASIPNYFKNFSFSLFLLRSFKQISLWSLIPKMQVQYFLRIGPCTTYYLLLQCCHACIATLLRSMGHTQPQQLGPYGLFYGFSHAGSSPGTLRNGNGDAEPGRNEAATRTSSICRPPPSMQPSTADFVLHYQTTVHSTTLPLPKSSSKLNLVAHQTTGQPHYEHLVVHVKDLMVLFIHT